MSEHREPIPSMIYNAAVGGHVTNSQQIIDEDYNLEQKDINKETLGIPYNASNPNGMGKIVLKKNDNFKQVVEAQTDGNTIFVIKYDFTLTGDVDVPANCVLEFDGGSISGAYTLTGTNTGISAGLVKIFNTNVTLAGTWNLNITHPEWFGSVGDGTITDDTLPIQKAINFAELGSNRKKVVLSKPHRINNTITITTASFDGNYNAIHYYGNGTAISLIGNHYMSTIKNFVLSNEGGQGLNGIKNENEGTDTSSGLNNAWIERITIYSFLEYGFHFSNAWLCNISDIRAEECGTGFYINRGYNCKLRNINAELNNIGIDLHIASSSFRGCCLDGCKQIGIKLSYVFGCSIEDVHFECNSDNVVGIKFISSSSCSFKNIFASTDTGRNFTLFDLDSGNGYCIRHNFKDIKTTLYNTDYIFNLSSYPADYLRVYNITIENNILNDGSNFGIYRGGTGIITWLSCDDSIVGRSAYKIEKVTNGNVSLLFAIEPSNSNGFQLNYETIREKKLLLKLNSGDTWIASQSHVSKGILKVYTNYGTATYYYDVSNSIFNLLETSNSSVFNPSGLRAGFWQGNVIFTCSGVTPTEDDKIIIEFLNEL